MVSKMEILFCLSVFLGITSTFAQMDESKYNVALKEFSKALHDECVKHHKVTDDEIWKLKTGIFDDNNDEMKNYVLCLWKESGTLDLSTFRLSKLLVEVYIPKELNNGNHVTMYLDCTTRGRELQLSGDGQRNQLCEVEYFITGDDCFHHSRKSVLE